MYMRALSCVAARRRAVDATSACVLRGCRGTAPPGRRICGPGTRGSRYLAGGAIAVSLGCAAARRNFDPVLADGRREMQQPGAVGSCSALPPEASCVDAAISYVRVPADGRRLHMSMLGTLGGPGRNFESALEPMRIWDGRPELAHPTTAEGLERAGITLICHPTSMATEDFYGDPERIMTVYYDEVCQAIRRVTGAPVVLAFHHLVRNEAVALEQVGGDRSRLAGFDNAPGGVGGYATNAHADYTPSTAAGTFSQQLQRIEPVCVRERFQCGRYMLINAWRNISQSPVRSNPLACLDARSLSEEDLVFVDLHYPGFTSQSLQLRHPPDERGHRWLYFPAMHRDELLLFKQFDSHPAVPTRYVFHCAFTDPSADVQAQPRESIEVRAIAFFPADEAQCWGAQHSPAAAGGRGGECVAWVARE